MYLGIVEAYTATADTNIPFTTEFNTNRNTIPNKTLNAVEITKPGFYNVTVTLNLFAADGTPVVATILANGEPLSGARVGTAITATTGTESLTINRPIRVTADNLADYGNISVQVNEDVTVDGNLAIERIQ